MPTLVQIGEEQVTVADSAKSLTAAEITNKVIMARMKLETAQIRYNAKTDPTAGGTEGSFIMDIGDEIEVWGQKDLFGFRGFRTGTPSGKLQVQYFGSGD